MLWVFILHYDELIMQTEDMQMDEEKEEDAALDFLSKNIGT